MSRCFRGSGTLQLLRQLFPSLEDFKNKLITFFAVFAHQGFDVFNRRSLQWFEAVRFVDFLDNTNYVVALSYISGQEVAHSAGWVCAGHIWIFYYRTDAESDWTIAGGKPLLFSIRSTMLSMSNVKANTVE